MSKRNAAARPAAVSDALRNAVGLLACAWHEFREANMLDSAAAVERSISDILRASCPGRLFCWDGKLAFIVRPETPQGCVEWLPMVSLVA